MKLFVLASFIAAAAAFAPSAQQGTFSSALFAVKKAPVKKAPLKKAPVKKASPVKKAPIKRAAPVKRGKAIAFENELGVQPPLGFWDPLGYLKNADAAKFEKLRGLEIKHGRVAQLAFLGYITTAYGIRLPGSLGDVPFDSIPGGFGALTTMPVGGIAQILLLAGYLEYKGWKQAEGSFPGDYSASSFPVGFLDNFAKTEEDKLKLRAQELNQGRAAQMGILSLMVHEALGVNILPPGASI